MSKPSASFWESPLVQLTLCRFREFFREPEAVFWVLVFPVLMASGLGVAFRDKPAEVLTVGAGSAAIARSLRAEPLLHVLEYSPADGERALREGRVVLVALPGADGAVTYLFDPTNPESRSARQLADQAVQVAAGRADPVKTGEQHVHEPGSRYIDFLIPGLLGMDVMSAAIWGMGFAIVDARRRKLLKRLIASPMPRATYLFSFLLSRLLLLTVDVAVLVGFGWLVFGVPLRGSLAGLAGLCILGSLAFSALGLLIASRVQTIEAASGLMNFIMLPMWIFSGVFFSAQRFPDMLQPFIRLLPLTAMIDALRGLMLRGASVQELAPEIGVLAGWMVICFALAMKLFRWR